MGFAGGGGGGSVMVVKIWDSRPPSPLLPPPVCDDAILHNEIMHDEIRTPHRIAPAPHKKMLTQVSPCETPRRIERNTDVARRTSFERRCRRQWFSNPV